MKRPTAAGDDEFPSPTYAANVLVDVFEDAKRLFLDYMIEVDRAHALMLAERKIISERDARTLISALDDLDRAGVRRAVYDGTCEDLFFYLERLVTEACGEEIAGKLHTARSRNDTDVTIYRMRLRTDALKLIRAVLDLRRTLLDIAAHNRETIIPAYTHTQPAQPTTLAHYMLAMAEVAGRDVTRLRTAYDALNRSPLGACAITTTGFPIDRERTAELLGFDSISVNSYAAVAATDYVTELLGAVSTLAINVGRFAQDLLVWATIEFGFLRLSNGYVQSSSIMPQKRNPVALEHVRALASKALGQSQAVLTVIHNTPFGDTNDVEDDLQPLVANALRDATRSAALFAAALSSARFDTERLRARAGADFIAVTELADTLVRNENLPFRVAHAVVAHAVRRAVDGERSDTELTHDTLQAAAREVTGAGLKMTAEELRDALDPAHFVRIRDIPGGPAPVETLRALEVERSRSRDDEIWHAAKIAREARRANISAE